MDFPAEVSTNSYVFDGSSDLAFAKIVPNSNILEPDKESESSLWTRIGRLRSAETELRKARVLVSLDLPKGELLTFYRKEDLQKDSKSMFNCVPTILRKNECHMISKQVTKTVDLLRPDRVNLHRHFKSAVLTMIKSVVEQSDNLIALDPGTFLFRDPSYVKRHDDFDRETGGTWSLIGLNTQLLPNGQATVHCEDTGAVFKRVACICRSGETWSYFHNHTKILFAPTGQYARYTGGYLGKLPSLPEPAKRGANAPKPNEEAILAQHKQRIWKVSVQEWLRQNELDFDCGLSDEIWIEIEVPLSKVENDEPMSLDGFAQLGKIMWEPMFWPTSLCFVNTMYQRLKPLAELPSSSFEDPMAFAKDWVRSAGYREAARKKLEQRTDVPFRADSTEGLHTFQNNSIHLDAGQSFRRVPTLDGPAATTIYPTPPDVALSHVTPGVMSMDGQAASPAAGTVVGQVEKTENNAEIVHPLGTGTAIGSGLYDEDLFEDVPGQNFGEDGMADEPNWDFFDEPDPDTAQNVDDMEIDVPAKAEDGTQGDLSFRHGDSQRSGGQVEIVSPRNNDGMGPHESGGVHEVEVIKNADNAASINHQEVPNDSDQVRPRHIARTSPPLSPIEVRKRLFADMAYPNFKSPEHNDIAGSHRRSLLEHSDHLCRFKPDLKVADNRYSANGLFWFETNNEKSSKTGSMELQSKLPNVGIPKGDQIAGSLKNGTRIHSPSSSSSAEDTDFDSSDFFSDSNKPGSPDKPNEEETDSLIVSPKPEDDGLDSETENKIRKEMLGLLELLRPEIGDQSSIKIHQPLQRPSESILPINRENLLTIAQVFVDQISQSFCHHDVLDSPPPGEDVRRLDICGMIQSIYGSATGLNLSRLAEISSGVEEAAEGNGVVDIPSPFLRLGRVDSVVETLPTILPFWETLGLQPLSGKKNIAAICIHPAGMHIEEGSSNFLQRLSEAYSNCNLGSHTTVEIQGMTQNGLVEWPVPKEPQMYGLLELCEKLGPSLATLPVSAANILVYVVSPFNKSSALAGICTAFVELFSSFAKNCPKAHHHELILQVVRMSFIASPETIVIPSQAEYFNLALEVYNRCPPANSSAAVAESGAAVTLAEPAAKNIHFILTTVAASPLSKDGDILHLAYSQSTDLRWIVACWTDNLGKTALTMTYCLRQKGSSVSRPRSEVIKELWEISADIMIRTRGHWRLSVAHDGPIEPEEINEWSFLANQSTSNGNTSSHCILTLLTFDTQPSIQFLPPPSTPPKPQHHTAATVTTTKYGTPASTPSAAAMTSSPEQLTASTPIVIPPTPSGFMTAPTPPEHQTSTQSHPSHGFDTFTDPDATLHDPTSESWSLILPFGLTNSNSPLSTTPPALQSGFLLKRRGALDSDGVVALGVNLVYTSSASTTTTSSSASGANGKASAMLSKLEQKNLLRETIRQWRGLCVLARTKGLTGAGAGGGVLPWHVRTAVVGCRAVSEVL